MRRLFCAQVLFRSGKPSSKLRVPFVPNANVGTDDLSAQGRRDFCDMQRFIAVEGYGQICMGSTVGNLAGVRIDAAGQVHGQHKGTALVQMAYQSAGSKAGRPQFTMESGAVEGIHNAGVPLVCCGEKMKELLPNTVEASGEKHLPVAELSGSTLTVTVGAVEHPMVDVHHIQWLFVETENGGQLRYLTPGQAPKAVFELGSEKPVAVYAYCNLHGLWMTKV